MQPRKIVPQDEWVAARKAFVILDGTLLAIDRVAMASGRDRPFYSGCEDRCASPRTSV